MPTDFSEVIGSVLMLVFFGLLLHTLWQIGRRFAPVSDAAPSGVDGWLMVIVSVAAGAGLFNLTTFGLLMNASLTQSAVAGGSGIPPGYWSVYGFPTAIACAGYLWAALRLLTGRTPLVRTEAAVGFWFSGPAAELPALLAGKGDTTYALLTGAAALAVTAYLFYSRRARHTYVG